MLATVELMKAEALKGVHGEGLSGAGRLRQEWKGKGVRWSAW